MKQWYQSKTLWMNVIGLMVLIVPVVLDALIATFPDVGQLPIWGTALLAVLNIVLRFATSEPLQNPFAK